MMSRELHCWSWRSCFANVKHTKKKKEKYQSKLTKNDQIPTKHSQMVDENSNILNQFDFNEPLIRNEYLSRNENDDEIVNDLINRKISTTVKSTPLDAIVEDLNEENSDEFEDTNQSIRLCSDRELIDYSNDLYTRLLNLSKMNHVIIQFNDHGYLLGEFTRHLSKFKLKIDDIQRASMEIPRDAELLEARYSTLLSTIESLSLLFKFAEISSSRSLIQHLIDSIEERMEQLNKLVQLSSSMHRRQQRQDLNDDDFLSFRSALSSYEHLLTLSS